MNVDVNLLRHIASICDSAAKHLQPPERQFYEDDSEYLGSQILEELENISIVLRNLIGAST